MKIIDAHAHIYERLTGFGPKGEARAIGNGMVEWATGQKEHFLREGHGDFGFSPDTLITLMDEANISHAVLLQGSNYGFQNSYIAEAVHTYPTRLTGAGTFDPYCAKAADIFQHLTEDFGFQILKFEISEVYGLTGYHPDLQIDGPVFAPYLELAAEKNITVVIDTGVIHTKSFQIEGIARVAERYPTLTLVVAHTLFPSQDGDNGCRLELIKHLKKENIFFDIANLQAPKGNTARLEYIRNVMDIVGAEHIAWGTDCPGVFRRFSYAELIDYIVNSGYFSDRELRLVMAKTAEHIYHIQD